MNSDTKSYESYQMLAKLLNSERKENIDRAYDALLSALNESYNEKIGTVKDEFRDKKNALARNRAKAEKYLGYFMTEKGYENSGIEADAKMKAQIGYNADMASLDREQGKSETDLLAKQHQAQAENEAQRAKEKSKADADFEDQLYKLKKEQDTTDVNLEKLRHQDYWKEKELEFEKYKIENGDDAEKLKSYRYLNYQGVLKNVEGAKDREELKSIYDSVTGVNTEYATGVLGYTNYKNLLKAIENTDKKLKAEEEEQERIEILYEKFVSAYGKEYHGLTYRKLAGDLKANEMPGYSKNELDTAYERFKKDLEKGVFENGGK